MESGSASSASPDETFALGQRLGLLLQAGDFIGLRGELGAGKTLFSRGVAAGLGAPVEDVSSPTYAIVQSYVGRIPLHHADLYRLSNHRDLHATGFFDLQGGDGALLVEWVDRIPSAAPEVWLEVSITAPTPTARKLEAVAHGARAEALLSSWLAG